MAWRAPKHQQIHVRIGRFSSPRRPRQGRQMLDRRKMFRSPSWFRSYRRFFLRLNLKIAAIKAGRLP